MTRLELINKYIAEYKLIYPDGSFNVNIRVDGFGFVDFVDLTDYLSQAAQEEDIENYESLKKAKFENLKWVNISLLCDCICNIEFFE